MGDLMELELAKVSEKGQIVIPANLRKDMNIKKSDQFMVFGEEDTIVLKRVIKRSMSKTLAELTKPLQKIVAEERFGRDELKDLIKKSRRK